MKKIILIVLILIIAVAGWWSVKHRSTPKEATTGYVVKNGKVYYDTVMHFGTGIGTSTRQQIDEWEVVGADAKTFTSVPVERGINAEADADPQTFASLSGWWGKDKTHIFAEGHEVLSAGTTTPTIDVRTFKLISDLFVRDAQHVYHIAYPLIYREVPALDPNTFVLLNSQYAKDSRAVYYIPFDGALYGFVKIPELNPDTFRIVGFCGGAEMYREYYVADAHTVMVKDTPIIGADPATFHIVGLVEKNPDGIGITGSYSVDKNRVYKDCGTIVPSVSPAQCTVDNLKGCEGNH